MWEHFVNSYEYLDHFIMWFLKFYILCIAVSFSANLYYLLRATGLLVYLLVCVTLVK